MRGSTATVSCAAVATVISLALAGCKYSTGAGPLPNPGAAPTFPPGTVSETPLPTANATPIGIAAGPDGNVWFAEDNANKIARVIPSTMVVTEFAIPTAASQPIDVTAGPTGNPNVWFDEFGASKIGYIVPSSGTFAEFPTPTANAGPVGLTADPTGNLWFGEFNVARIASITVGGVITETPIAYSNPQPNQPVPDSVVVAPDHTVWFLDPNNDVVGHMTAGPTFTAYPIVTPFNRPQFITVGGDGNLWFTEAGNPSLGQGCRIGRVNLGPSPSVTEFVLPLPQFAPYGDWCVGIAKGSDGNVWFAEAAAGAIGRIKPNGSVTEWGIPGMGTTAIGVANGPDGNLWFTDGNFGFAPGFIGTNQVGKVLIGLLPATSIRKSFQPKAVTHGQQRVLLHGAPASKRHR